MTRKTVKFISLFLILALSVVFISCKNNKEIVDETTTQSSEPQISSSTKTEPKEIESDPNLYSSDSNNFSNYSFLCPDGWKLFAEKDYSRIILKSGLDNETIMLSVEKSSDNKNLKDIEALINSYKDIGNETEISEIKDIGNVKTSSIDTEIYGYEYFYGNDKNQKAVDLFTAINQGENVYIIKYLGLGIEKEAAIMRLSEFLESFKMKKDTAALKESDNKNSRNILVLGDDSGLGRAGGRINGRTDIMMILHINLDKHVGTIVTIPRDTWTAIPGHGENKINSAHAVGGMELTIKTLEEFSGLKIDNYIITDMDGFPALVDYFGGVTVEIDENLSDGFSGCYLDKGIHHINGEQALALARNRHRSGGAFAREKEAAKIVRALYEQNSSLEKLIKLPAFLNIMLRYTWTDLKFKDLIYLTSVFGKIKADDIEITTIPSWPEMVGSASAVVYDKEATKELFEQIKEQ